MVFTEQTDGHNILSTLSAKQYRHILELMEDAILATDLMLFFDNRAKLEEIIKNNKFNWSTPEHRYWLFSCTVQKVKAFTVILFDSTGWRVGRSI